MTTEELHARAVGMLNTAKENLVQHGHLMPILLVVSETQNVLFGLAFESTEEKRKTYAALQLAIGQLKAIGVIMLNDVYLKRTEPGDIAALERMEQNGVRNEPGRQEAIVAVVSPRDGEDYMLVQHYHREGATIVFDEQVKTDGCIESRLLPPSWKYRPALAHVGNN